MAKIFEIKWKKDELLNNSLATFAFLGALGLEITHEACLFHGFGSVLFLDQDRLHLLIYGFHT